MKMDDLLAVIHLFNMAMLFMKCSKVYFEEIF